MKPFANKYRLEGINHPSKKKKKKKNDQKKIGKNNLVIVLNILFAKNEKIYPPYVSKHNSKHKK